MLTSNKDSKRRESGGAGQGGEGRVILRGTDAGVYYAWYWLILPDCCWCQRLSSFYFSYWRGEGVSHYTEDGEDQTDHGREAVILGVYPGGLCVLKLRDWEWTDCKFLWIRFSRPCWTLEVVLAQGRTSNGLLWKVIERPSCYLVHKSLFSFIEKVSFFVVVILINEVMELN